MTATLIPTLFIIGIAIIGLSFNILFRKKPFPETHVGHNKEMRKRGIMCVKSMDAQEQKKGWAQQKGKYAKLKLDTENQQ